jgi:hypothetical protein
MHVHQAYLGSLGRRVRDATCARLGVNRFFAPLFFTWARGASRGAKISGSACAASSRGGVWALPNWLTVKGVYQGTTLATQRLPRAKRRERWPQCSEE